MSQPTARQLEHLAQAAAQAVYGAGAVERVVVEEREDSTGAPAYYFSFVVKDPLRGPDPGHRRADLRLRLRDALLARGDEHYPFIEVLDPAGWARRAGA